MVASSVMVSSDTSISASGAVLSRAMSLPGKNRLQRISRSARRRRA
jgi:hypothetical protein